MKRLLVVFKKNHEEVHDSALRTVISVLEDSREAGEIESVDHRVFRESKHDRRDSKQPRDLVLLNQGETLLEIEARDRHDRRSLAEEEIHQHLHAVDVEEGQHADEGVGAVEAHVLLSDLQQVGHDVPVRELDALGHAGGARGVRHGDDLVGAHVGAARLAKKCVHPNK